MLVDETHYRWVRWEQPVVHSNTDWGEISATSVCITAGKDYSPYRAFDGDSTTIFQSAKNESPTDLIWKFEVPLRIYRIELVNKTSSSDYVTKDVIIYADEEKTTEIGRGQFEKKGLSKLAIEPDVPVACDMVVIQGTTYREYLGYSEIVIYAESGEIKSNLRDYYNTTEGMTCVRDTPNDDNTDTLVGLSTFMFNGVAANNLYVSGNEWVGIGTNAEQLQVLRRDGKCYYLYRQEGELLDGTGFLKIRWEGYTVYSSADVSNRLIFELFLLSNNDMVLNVVQTPTNTSALGSSALNCHNKTTALSLATGDGAGKVVSFYHLDESGYEWRIEYSDYEGADNYEETYLIKSGDAYYKIIEDELVAVDIERLSAAMFYIHGFEGVPKGALLTSLEDPEVLRWTNHPSSSIKTKATVVAHPYPQILLARADLSSTTILGIRLLTADYSGTIGVKLSFDMGETYDDEITMDEFINLEPDELFERSHQMQSIYIQFILYSDAMLTSFKMTYQN